jgi:ribose transport system permease protein
MLPSNPSGTVEAPRSALKARLSFRRRVLRVLSFDELGVLAVLVIFVLVVGYFTPSFLSKFSMINVAQQAALFGIMALGMVFLLSMREIDLSVGSLYGLLSATAAVLMRDGVDPWLAALAAIALGVLLGAVNASMATLFGIATIIVTLGSLSMFRGLTLILSGSKTVGDLPRDHAFFEIMGGRIADLPVIVWAFVVLAVVLHVVYRATPFGISVRALGSDPDAAQLNGLSLHRVRLGAMALTGGLCGVAGVLTLAYFESADTQLGTGYELLVIAAAIIGGTALAGGRGTVLGALFGALLLAAVQSGLVQFGVEADWSIFATGAVIVLAVALDGVVRKRRAEAEALAINRESSRSHTTQEGEESHDA